MYVIIYLFKGDFMLKKTLTSIVVSCTLATGVMAADLKEDMGYLTTHLAEVQMGLFTNNVKQTLESTKLLKEHVHKTLGDEDSVKKLLPENVKHKASIAVNSAEIIEKNVKIIEKALKDTNSRMINRQMKSQKAFEEIQTQCFRCHNLVRDW